MTQKTSKTRKQRAEERRAFRQGMREIDELWKRMRAEYEALLGDLERRIVCGD